jgi:hypothetical protein
MNFNRREDVRKWWAKWRKHAGWVADAIGLAISIGLAIAAYFAAQDSERTLLLKILAVFWGVAPPIWFIAEWRFYPGLTHGPHFEEFKLSQERAKDLWIGVGAALVLLFHLA